MKNVPIQSSLSEVLTKKLSEEVFKERQKFLRFLYENKIPFTETHDAVVIDLNKANLSSELFEKLKKEYPDYKLHVEA
jgi:hypothetical protein